MKKLFSVLLVLAIAMALCAPAMAEGYKIAINLKTLSSEYWQTVKSGCDQAAEELGVNIDVQGPSAESAIQEQVDQIETMLSGNPDAIIIAPDDGDAVIGALVNSGYTGPVFFCDTDCAYEEKVSFIGTSNQVAAYEGGVYGVAVNGEATKALIIYGQEGDNTSNLRKAGYEQALAEAGLEPVAEVSGNNTTDGATKVMENQLIANPDINDSKPEGWNIILGTGNQPTNVGQYWTGDANNRYLDSWNGTAGKLNFTAYQILTDIPNGTYKLNCYARSSGANVYLFAATAPYADVRNDSTMAIAVQAASTRFVEFPNDADVGGEIWLADSLIWAEGGEMTEIFNAHDGNGWGWAIREIDDIVVDNHIMTIGVTSDSILTQKPGYTGTWFSADEFRLTLKSLGDNSDYVIDTRIVNAAAEPAHTEFFTIDGRQLAEPQKGINIVRTVRADGIIEIRKVMVR